MLLVCRRERRRLGDYSGIVEADEAVVILRAPNDNISVHAFESVNFRRGS